jgi:serine protease
MTLGGKGDVSLYVAAQRVPSASDYDAKSTRPTNSESVRIGSPSAVTYMIRLTGTYSGLTLVARQ